MALGALATEKIGVQKNKFRAPLDLKGFGADIRQAFQRMLIRTIWLFSLNPGVHISGVRIKRGLLFWGLY